MDIGVGMGRPLRKRFFWIASRSLLDKRAFSQRPKCARKYTLEPTGECPEDTHS